MSANNSNKRSAKHLTKKVPKITMQTIEEGNKKLCSRCQTFHKLEKKLAPHNKYEDISSNEGIGKPLQKPHCSCNIMHIMKTGTPLNKTSDELSRYLRCATKCDTCLKLDYENRNKINVLSNKKFQNDLHSLACVLKDYIVVNNYSPEKIYDLEKLNGPQITPQEKYEMSKLFELVFMRKSKSAHEVTKKEFQISQENLKTNEICEEKDGRLSNEITQLEQSDTLQEAVFDVNYDKEKDEKCLLEETCGEKHEIADGVNPSIEVIMPPNLTKIGKESNLSGQNAPEMNIGERNILGTENEYLKFLNAYTRKNYEKTASARLKNKTVSVPHSLNKDGHQIHNRHQSETKSSYIAASNYGSPKLSHLRSRLLKKLCNSRNVPEILKYKLYLAKLPIRVVLSNIYPYIGNEMQSMKPNTEKCVTVPNKVKKTRVKRLTNIFHNSNENLPQEMKSIKENICPEDHSVTEIVIGNISEEELSKFFGRERKNKFEKFCEIIESSQSHINEHKSYSMLHLFEKLCKNKSTLSKMKGNDDKEDKHTICLKKSHSVETSKPRTKPKIKLEVHIPRVPINYDEPTEETKKQNEFLARGSTTQINEKQDCYEEKIVGVSQTREFKIQEEKSHSLQQHSNIIKMEEYKGKPNAVLSKISKRTKLTGKGKNSVITPRANKRKQILNENKFFPNIAQKSEVKDEKYWKNEFYKRLKCISQKGVTENDSLNEILNHVVSVIKSHWGECVLNR